MTQGLTQESRFFDNSMISSYKECPRKFQLRYRFNWRAQGTSMPLIFGLSWHAGQDALWTAAKRVSPVGGQNDLREFAVAGFMNTWIEQGMPEQPQLEDLERMGARTPMNAAEMYVHYIEQRWTMLQEAELIACEQPFAVPMPGLDNVWYAGRLDKVIKYQGQTLVIEHKTTSEYKIDGGFRASYVESWFSDSQVKGYQFGGSLYYNDLAQIWVDAALVHKKVHNAFRFIPVSHQFPLLAEWVNDTREWIQRIERDVERNYFPKNEGACVGKYGPCTFLNICRTTSSPEKLEEVPHGYMVEEWKPFDVLKLGKLLEQA